jgi:Flp pilus assembly protein TadG
MLRLRVPRIFRRFRKAQNGLAAVEFAMILPVMITMVFGMSEVSMAVLCRTDVTQIASTTADLIAQGNSVSANDLTNVYNAANVILYPYPKGGNDRATIRITSVLYSSADGKTGTVAWTCTQTGSGTLSPATRSKNSTVTFSQSLLTAGSSVLMVEVAYQYNSPTMKTIAGSFNFKDQFYTRPRRVAQIPAPSPAPTGCST